MVSYPYYDNQLFVTGISSRKWKEYIDDTKGNAFLNRADSRTLSTRLDVQDFPRRLGAPARRRQARYGHLYLPRRDHGSQRKRPQRRSDNGLLGRLDRASEHDALDLYGAIEQSCDIYFYNVAQEYIKPVNAFDPIYYYDWNLLGTEVVSSEQERIRGAGDRSPCRGHANQVLVWTGITGIEILDEAARPVSRPPGNRKTSAKAGLSATRSMSRSARAKQRSTHSS